MKYYNLAKNNYGDEPVLFKMNKKALVLAKRLAKLARQHAKLDWQFIEELAKVNNIETFEVSSLLADYDFLVSMTEYGDDLDLSSEEREITKEEYERFKNAHSN